MNKPAIRVPSRNAGPYKGLDHYEEQDSPMFFGRQAERDLVIANLLASRLTLLYGDSGVGKTSLLLAGVVPRLRDVPDVAVVIFRSWAGHPVADLSEAIRRAAALPPPVSPSTLAETIKVAAERLGRDLVVLLDQFEEYFVYHPEESGTGTFAVEFPQAVNRAELPVSFLVSVREDALAQLDRFKARLPGVFGNYLRLERLSGEAGRDAIVRPLEMFQRGGTEPEQIGIEPELVATVLDQVRVGSVQLGEAGAGMIGRTGTSESPIEAPYLQLVLTRLWDEENAAGSHMLRSQTLDRLGGAGQILRAHVEAAMLALPRAQRDLAGRISRFLVTPSAAKSTYSASDLAGSAEAPADDVASLLNRLSGPQAGILRAMSDGRYEIRHDALAGVILDWGSRLEAVKIAMLRWQLGLVSLVLIAFIGADFGYQFTQRPSSPRILAALIIALGITGMLIFLLISLRGRQGHAHLRRANSALSGHRWMTQRLIAAGTWPDAVASLSALSYTVPTTKTMQRAVAAMRSADSDRHGQRSLPQDGGRSYLRLNSTTALIATAALIGLDIFLLSAATAAPVKAAAIAALAALVVIIISRVPAVFSALAPGPDLGKEHSLVRSVLAKLTVNALSNITALMLVLVLSIGAGLAAVGVLNGTPVPMAYSTGVVLDKLVALREFVAAQTRYEFNFNYVAHKSFLFLTGESIHVVGSGTDSAIVGFSSLTGGTVQRPNTTSVTVILSKPYLSTPAISLTQTKLSEQGGLLTHLSHLIVSDPNDAVEALRVAQAKIAADAANGPLISQAEASTRTFLIKFLQRLGFKHIKIVFV